MPSYVVTAHEGDSITAPLLVSEVEVVSDDGTNAEIRLPDGTRLSVGSDKIYASPILAQRKAREGRYRVLTSRIGSQLTAADLPGEILRPAFVAKASGNPLRWAERNFLNVMQSNAFGPEITEQKLIQLLGVARTDIRMPHCHSRNHTVRQRLREETYWKVYQCGIE